MIAGMFLDKEHDAVFSNLEELVVRLRLIMLIITHYLSDILPSPQSDLGLPACVLVGSSRRRFVTPGANHFMHR